MSNEEKYREYIINEYERMNDYLSKYIDVRNIKKIGVGALDPRFEDGLFIIDNKWFIYEMDDYLRPYIKGPLSFEGAAYFYLMHRVGGPSIMSLPVTNEDIGNYLKYLFMSYKDALKFITDSGGKYYVSPCTNPYEPTMNKLKKR